jgi:hypothetical protein
VVRVGEGVLAPSDRPRHSVVRVPLTADAPGGDGGHGGGVGETGEAGAARLPSIGGLAAVELVVKEGGGVAGVRKGALAAGVGPRRCVIGVPLGGGGGGVGEPSLARA